MGSLLLIILEIIPAPFAHIDNDDAKLYFIIITITLHLHEFYLTG